jgi:putative DNA primase/helicase
MITQLAPVYYRPEEGSPTTGLWIKCLRKWHNGDQEAIDYLQRLAGMCLTGDTSSRCFPIFYGEGKNGKNTFLDALMFMMGDYAGTAPRTLLKESRNEEHATEIDGLLRKRLVVASETKKGMKLKTSLVKAMTGDKMMRARFMRQDYFEFQPTHKVVLMTNELPVIDETTDAIWDRVHLMKWGVRIPTEEQDTHLDEKLRKEWTGILRWAIAGCLRWQSDGILKPTETIQQQTEEYRNDQNPLKSFIEEECIIGPDQFVSVADMRSVYDRWIDQFGRGRTIYAQEFNRSLEALGAKRVPKWIDGRNVKCWIGIGFSEKK